MFWHKKEEGHGLPELPPVRIISATEFDDTAPHEDSHEDEFVEKHGLPSFPDSPIHKGFSQAAIKDAISSQGIDERESSSDRMFKTVEIEHSWPSQPSIPSMPTHLTIPPAMHTMDRAPVDRTYLRDSGASETRTKDVFVRIDKFYAARKALETTRDKLNEIDELLRKIRETKMREEQELNGWEKELAEIKSRIVDVSENIFEKIE